VKIIDVLGGRGGGGRGGMNWDTGHCLMTD